MASLSCTVRVECLVLQCLSPVFRLAGCSYFLLHDATHSTTDRQTDRRLTSILVNNSWYSRCSRRAVTFMLSVSASPLNSVRPLPIQELVSRGQSSAVQSQPSLQQSYQFLSIFPQLLFSNACNLILQSTHKRRTVSPLFASSLCSDRS